MTVPEVSANAMFVIQVLVGLVTACLGWWVNGVSKMLNEQQKAHNDTVLQFQKQISDINLQLARDYMPRKELQETLTRIFISLEEIKDSMRTARRAS